MYIYDTSITYLTQPNTQFICMHGNLDFGPSCKIRKTKLNIINNSIKYILYITLTNIIIN